MDWNVILPFASAVLSLIFALMLLDQWRTRRRPYQLVWAIGMLWYGISAGTEWFGGAFGWSEPLYRAWYLIGAVWVAAWLGLGTVYLLARTRFGYSLAFSFALAALFTYLSWKKYEYPDSGIAIWLYPLVGLSLAAVIVVLTYRGSHRWASLTGAALVVGTIVSAILVLTVPLPPPGYYVDPVTGIPAGTLYPGYIRLLTPFFNITGGFALVLGAVYSAYVFMPKRRVVHYDLRTDAGLGTFLRNLAISPFAILINLVASIPGAVKALFSGQLDGRVPATALIALGGLIPSITSGMNRFGETGAFFLGEFLGVVFLFAGFAVSAQVLGDVRIPFTGIVLLRRNAPA
jgi:hypothetical protein